MLIKSGSIPIKRVTNAPLKEAYYMCISTLSGIVIGGEDITAVHVLYYYNLTCLNLVQRWVKLQLLEELYINQQILF